MLVGVAEVLSHGECREAHAHAGTGGLVHLAVAERHLRFGKVVGVDHTRFLEFLVKVVAFPGALANAGEHGNAAVLLGDVVDQLLDQHGLANAGTAEQANLAALAVGRQQVDHLDAGLKHLGLGLQLSEEGGGAVNRSGLGGGYWTLLIHRLAEHVEDATEGGLAHWYADR